MRWRLATAAACMLAAACGTPAATNVHFDPDASLRVPPVLEGLEVREESTASRTLERAAKRGNAYVVDGNVYGLRLRDELKAVLQVSKLAPDARPDDKEFRRKVVNQIGARVTRPRGIAGVLVYQGTANEQQISVWFVEGFMNVLMIREEETLPGEGLGFDPEALLRAAAALRRA